MIAIVAGAVALGFIGIPTFVMLRFVFRLAALFRLSSLNQYLFLIFMVFNICRASLVLLWPRMPTALALRPTLWMLFCFVLFIADRRKLYRVEIFGLAACGLWHFARIPVSVVQSGLTISTVVSALSTILSLVLFGAIMSHPLDVLQRASRMKRLKTQQANGDFGISAERGFLSAQG